MESPQKINETLGSFTGTEHYYKHLFGVLYTDGVKYVADACEAHWLVDIVASYQKDPKIKGEYMQVYNLKVNEDKTAVVEISDGNENILATQKLEYTDFPLSEMEFWCIDGVIILPSEY